jgi:hypothetical protein
MSAKVQCPRCQNVSPIPDAFLGKKVRCNKCKGEFLANPREGVSSSASANSPGGAVTVVARRAGAAVSPPVWLAAAGLALVLPILAATAFAALMWDRGGRKAPGESYGAIEVGSKGVKYAFFEVSPDPDYGYQVGSVIDGSTNTNLVQGMEEGGHFNPDGLAETAAAVRTYYDDLTKTHAIPPERVFIVGSSGLEGPVAKRKDLNPAEKKDLTEKNRAQLAEAVQKAVGKRMGFVNPEEEAQFQIEGVVPRRDRDAALFIDVGSGSTRGGYREGRIIKKLEGPGVRNYHDKVEQALRGRPGASFADVAAELADVNLRDSLRKQVEHNHGLVAPEKVYLVGGIVWVMASYVHPENRKPHVPLSADDIDGFAAKVHQNPDLLLTFTPPAGLDDKERKLMEEDIRRMKKNFNPNELLAGSEILKALSAELKFKTKKELWFYRYGHVAWVVEYVASQAQFAK